MVSSKPVYGVIKSWKQSKWRGERRANHAQPTLQMVIGWRFYGAWYTYAYSYTKLRIFFQLWIVPLQEQTGTTTQVH